MLSGFTNNSTSDVSRANELLQLRNPDRERILGRVHVVSKPRGEPLAEAEEVEEHVDDILDDVAEEDVATHEREDELSVAESGSDEGGVLSKVHGDVDDGGHGGTEPCVSDVDRSDAHDSKNQSSVNVGRQEVEAPFSEESEETRDSKVGGANDAGEGDAELSSSTVLCHGVDQKAEHDEENDDAEESAKDPTDDEALSREGTNEPENGVESQQDRSSEVGLGLVMDLDFTIGSGAGAHVAAGNEEALLFGLTRVVCGVD